MQDFLIFLTIYSKILLQFLWDIRRECKYKHLIVFSYTDTLVLTPYQFGFFYQQLTNTLFFFFLQDARVGSVIQTSLGNEGLCLSTKQYDAWSSAADVPVSLCQSITVLAWKTYFISKCNIWVPCLLVALPGSFPLQPLCYTQFFSLPPPSTVLCLLYKFCWHCHSNKHWAHSKHFLPECFVVYSFWLILNYSTSGTL